MATSTTIAVPSLNRQKVKITADFVWLSAFYLVYCARPEDWFKGLGIVPLAKITGIGAFIAFLVGSGKGKRKLRDLPIEFHLLLAMITVLMTSSMLSDVWRGGAVSRTMDFAKVWVVCALTFLLVTDIPKFRRIVFIQAVSVPLISLLSIVKGHSQARLEGVLGGIYSNSNDLAFAIALSLPLALMFCLTAPTRFRKILWTLGMLVMGAAFCMTGSRGGLITIVCAGGVCLWHFAVKGKRKYLIVMTVLAGIVLLGVAGKTMRDRFYTLFDSSKMDTKEEYRAIESTEQRRYLIDRAFEGIREYPILGMGTRNFETYSNVWLEVHVTYLQIAVEGGLLSFTLFMLFFWRGFRNLKVLLKRDDLDPEVQLFVGALHSVLIGFIVGASFSPEAYQFFPFFAVAYTSTLLAIVRDADRKKNAALKPSPSMAFRQLATVSAGRAPVNT